MSSAVHPETPGSDDEAQAQAELAKRRLPAMARLRTPAQPGYRVVEVVRDAEGRVRKQGSIWHPTLDVTRRFARAVAANTDSHRVLVADSHGRVLEEVPLPGADQRCGLWDGAWRQLPLPELAKPTPPPRRLPTAKTPRHAAPAAVPAPVVPSEPNAGVVDVAIFEDH